MPRGARTDLVRAQCGAGAYGPPVDRIERVTHWFTAGERARRNAAARSSHGKTRGGARSGRSDQFLPREHHLDEAGLSEPPPFRCSMSEGGIEHDLAAHPDLVGRDPPLEEVGHLQRLRSGVVASRHFLPSGPPQTKKGALASAPAETVMDQR